MKPQTTRQPPDLPCRGKRDQGDGINETSPALADRPTGAVAYARSSKGSSLWLRPRSQLTYDIMQPYGTGVWSTYWSTSSRNRTSCIGIIHKSPGQWLPKKRR
jgi:hypothetical protein